MRKSSLFLLAGAVALASVVKPLQASPTTTVSPSNMNGWTFGSFDNNFNPVNTGPYVGTGEMVTGPATPPLGVGSAHLATPTNFGDGAEIIQTNHFNGTPLAAITTLGYSTFMTTNNGSQMPYLDLVITTDGGPVLSDGSNLDFITFEPPYQQPSTGNPSLPNQGASTTGVWQTWNAAEGGWYDGTIGGDGGDHVVPLSAFLTAYPNAVIADPSSVYPGFGGIDLEVGFASHGESFDGNVDNFSFGAGAGTTTYDFEPDATPEPASLGILGVGAMALLAKRRRTR